MRSDIKKLNYHLYILLTIVALSLFLNIYGINWGLPALWHPDERDTIRSIVIPMARHLDPNPHNFLKPSFYYYFLEIILSPFFLYYKIAKPAMVFGLDFVSIVTLISRTVTAIIGTASVFLLYLIGKTFFNANSGLFAGLFLAISMGFATHSHFAYMDIPMIFLMLLMVLLSLQYLETHRISKLYLASLAGGLAISTKYNAGLPVILILLICNWDQISVIIQKERTIKERIKAILPKPLIISIMLVSLGFILGTPFSLLDFPAFAGTILKQMFIAKHGYKGFVGSTSWSANLSDLKYALGMPLFLLSIGGLFWGFVSFLRNPNRKAAVLLSIPIIYYAYIGSWHISQLRYILLIIPLLVLWAAGLVGSLLKSMRGLRIPIFIVVVLIMSYSGFYTFRGVRCFSNDTRKISGEWIRANIHPQSLIETYSIWAYLPKFSKNLNVLSIRPNFIVESPAFEQFKMELKSNPTIVWFLKTFKKDIKIRVLSDHPNNKGKFSLNSLEKRKPDYIVLTSFYFRRYIKKYPDAKSSPYPVLTDYFAKLIRGELGYKIIARFEDKTPTGEFINPTITVLKKEKAL